MPATTSSSALLQPVSPRHAVLEECVAIALRHVADDFRDLCTTLAGKLVDGGRMTDPSLVRERLRAGNLLRDRHFALLHLAVDTLEQALRRELAQLAPRAEPETAPALSLVPYEEMDERVRLAAMARPFEHAHGDALAALDARLARLFDRADLRASPFRPAVFLDALREAWGRFDGEGGSVALVLPLLGPGCFYDLGRLYAALNVALERHGVPSGRPRTPASHDGRRHAAVEQRLRQFFGQADGVVVAAPADQRLQAYLASLPVPAGAANAAAFHLPAVKRAAPPGTLSRQDEGAIDLLAAVFDTVARDDALAPESRDLLQLLQLPVLKAALADKAFFFAPEHPARRLVDLLAQMGWERAQRGDGQRDDAQYQAMRRSVDRAFDAGDEVMAAFTHAVRELEAVLRDEEAQAAAAIAAPVAAALKQEKTATARCAARAAVALRLGGGDVAAVVEAFLDQRWTDVLTVAYAVDDDKPGAVRHATQAMDDLLWSVRPQVDAAGRRQLIARLPGLLAALNQWLDVIKWHDGERLRFFAELAECHASIVRAPLDVAPARRVELSVQAAQLAAERRAARQASLAADGAADAAENAAESAALAALTRGTWFAFGAGDGGTRNVKLAWISPMRTLFVFSNGARAEAFSLPAAELAQRLAAGSATVVRSEGVVVRALAEALAVNDDDVAMRAAG